MKFTSSKATDLCFSDDAREGCVKAIDELRREWTRLMKEPRQLFGYAAYKSLQTELKAIASERTRHELELQSHFDHHSQGASQSESVKPERVPQKVANDLHVQSAKAGFRQIQLIDPYCLSRGNEMWAIIPSLLRVGHDVDPILCMHWKPSMDDLPEGLKPSMRNRAGLSPRNCSL